VGLGGGVVPRAIRKVFPDVEIDTVELDPAVARVAKSYFGFSGDAHSQVFVDDGRVFIRKQRRAGVKYDIVMLDAFEKTNIPEALLTVEFLREVKSLLNPGGVVAANTFAGGALQRYESATYQAVFGDIFDVDVITGNRIILAGRDGIPSVASMRVQGKALDQDIAVLGFSSDSLLQQIKQQPPEKGVRVLTDQFSPSNLLLQSPQ
jgi:spermidine synthase